MKRRWKRCNFSTPAFAQLGRGGHQTWSVCLFWKTASDRSCFVAAAAQLTEKPHAALWRRVTHECTVTFTPLTYHEALIRSKHAVLKTVKFPKQKCPVGHLRVVCTGGVTTGIYSISCGLPYAQVATGNEIWPVVWLCLLSSVDQWA